MDSPYSGKIRYESPTHAEGGTERVELSLISQVIEYHPFRSMERDLSKGIRPEIRKKGWHGSASAQESLLFSIL
jgi:hypothetical protein